MTRTTKRPKLTAQGAAEVEPEIWLSECGLYYAVKASCYQPAYDVCEVSGGRVWLWQRSPGGMKYAEFSRMVVSWSSIYKRGFELGFYDLDQSIELKPLTGNASTARYEARFTKHTRPKRSVRESITSRVSMALIRDRVKGETNA